MKAQFTLGSSIDRNAVIAAITLVSLAFWIYPEASFGAGLHQTSETSEPKQSALVFEIKNPETVIQKSQTNTNLITFDEIVKTDPLVPKLQAYLESKDSPLAEYAAEIVQQPQWKRSLAISFVESNFGKYCANNNCSGIGVAPGHASWRKYETKLDWFKDMSKLMETPRYKERFTTYKTMRGIYVYPGSARWVYGAEKVDAELTKMETEANELRIASLPNTNVTSASMQNIELATLNFK